MWSLPQWESLINLLGSKFALEQSNPSGMSLWISNFYLNIYQNKEDRSIRRNWPRFKKFAASAYWLTKGALLARKRSRKIHKIHFWCPISSYKKIDQNMQLFKFFITSLMRGARWSCVPALSSQPWRPRMGLPLGSPQAWSRTWSWHRD